MGVPIGEAEGNHIIEMQCRECEVEYETDETMTNECPNCLSPSWEIIEE